MQGTSAYDGVGEHPARVRRRVVPDAAQVQIILGSLLGDGRIEGRPGARRLVVVEPGPRARYVWWKYEHLFELADESPTSLDGDVSFRTIAHPLFDDLTQLSRSRIRALLTTVGRAVRRTDGLAHAPLMVSDSTAPEDLIRE